MGELSLAEAGKYLKTRNVAAYISYGSGGYCCVLTQVDSGKSYSGYSWSLADALSIAIAKVDENEIDERDEPTDPDIKG